jgi:DNA-binding MarR family transcriptional regulator
MFQDNIFTYISFLKASKNRFLVFCSLATSGAQVPSDMAKKLGLRPEHVSRALKQLQNRELVVCRTPSTVRGRVYDLTNFGLDIYKNLPQSSNPLPSNDASKTLK